MAHKNRESRQASRLDKTRAHIETARRTLARSVFAHLLPHVTLQEWPPETPRDMLAATDPRQGAVWLNPHHRHDLEAPEWTFILAHQLLHLALGHQARRGGRDPLLWNVACDVAADNLLTSLKLGRPPRGYAIDPTFSGMSEEDIYYLLAAESRKGVVLSTFAGPGKSDMITAEPVYRYDLNSRRRSDYETLFASGIRDAVEYAIADAAEMFGQEAERKGVWRPAERARRWVQAEFPLLGALSMEMTVIADESVCNRMDISVAAVNGFIGEIYFHPRCPLTQPEMIFVYVHELLHVALQHHMRSRGRDPHLWNIACDFVINGWLVEMGIGSMPQIGVLYDPRLANMSAEEVYDLLIVNPSRCNGKRGLRGKLGDILLDIPQHRIYRDDVTTLDDVYRRCLATGLSCCGSGRGFIPAGLLEEIRSLFTPPVPWDVELARWMDGHVPIVREKRRTYARASRRQSSTPDIPRPARYVPQEWRDASTFGVVLDTSGSMERELLGRALGAIASYSEARDVESVRLVMCDAAPYDRGFVVPQELRGVYPVTGRGGTALQPAINHLLGRPDFPATAPIMIITDGWCESEILCPRDHCFVMPRKQWKQGAVPLRTTAPIFRVLKESHLEAGLMGQW